MNKGKEPATRGGVPAPGGGACSWECCSKGVPAPEGSCGDPLPQKQMATVAAGTHPTGMHSC